ncbi:cation diffusion facilitator family transporter [Neptunomonas qingdaonensis]|uniref:Cobalt-zinc-cadmium efflux system protein n=1 Tax=Neptunomonas qingdaonensis TaxID=1045558 RepID=A0A1I2M881_9GAMM|nr:cation diffusion facilitator family transporter [Neptunomonas qingdaonensis]SFF87735.1 cobalt-zinc-cadmium efflux system protein [Neptunomonas qingdaonensis]
MTHQHTHTTNYGRLFGIGIALNIGYVLLELSFGWHINSLALLADAAHNVGDVAGLLLAWIAVAMGNIKANQRHTFAWKKASILASFFNAAILLLAMGALAWEAISRLDQVNNAQPETIIWVASVGVIINAITAALFIKGSQSDLNIRGAFLHMAADALVSLAVVISGILYIFWPLSWLDPMMSLIVATVVVLSTWSLFKRSTHLLFEGVPDDINPESVSDALIAHPHVQQIHDLHIWAMSTTENSLSVHLVINQPDDNSFELLEEIKELIRHQFKISHVTIQIESLSFAEQCSSLSCTFDPQPLSVNSGDSLLNS